MNTTRAAIVIGLLLLPASAFPQSAETAGASPPRSTTVKATMHATKGVVTFVDANKLVIARSPRTRKEVSFVLNPATERVGDVKVGTTVDVRYRTEAEQKIATAISVEHQKQP